MGEPSRRSGPLAIRVRPDDLKAIDARAKAAGMSRNAYIIRSSLGELNDPSTTDRRLGDLEARIEVLERWQSLGG